MDTAVEVHFDCVFYYVRDLERAVVFYSDVLGLELKSCDVVARFDIDGILFELVPTSTESVVGGSGNARLCLRVRDVRAAAAALRAQGVSVGEPKRVENGVLAGFEDPDGNELVLWQYT